jgi:hypothetical protein
VILRAAIAAAALLAFSASAQANDVTAVCKVGGATVSCGSWHSADVNLSWNFDPNPPDSTTGCDLRKFSSDTPVAGTSITCTAFWGADFAGATATVRVDQTKPVVSGATTSRPPDYGGWFNHPVSVTFAGTDALSGIASCDTVQVAGPDSGALQVNGGCRDVAGNRAVTNFPIAYDSTPPAAAQVAAEPENGSVKLSWVPPPDASAVVVTRQTQSSARGKTVYRGTGHDVTDKGLRNGVRYRYAVTVLDQAGNSSVTNASAVPTASSLRPVQGTALSGPPRLTWRSVKGATYYNVQLFKGRKKVLSAWPHGSHLQLKGSWRFHGHRLRLRTGTYRWYVWPGFGARSSQQYGRMLGKSSFRVSG